jgi:hypothetical protein
MNALTARRLISNPPRVPENLDRNAAYQYGVDVGRWAESLARTCRPLIPESIVSVANTPKPPFPTRPWEREPGLLSAAFWLLAIHRMLVQKLSPTEDGHWDWCAAGLGQYNDRVRRNCYDLKVGDGKVRPYMECRQVRDGVAKDIHGQPIVEDSDLKLRASEFLDTVVLNTIACARCVIEASESAAPAIPAEVRILQDALGNICNSVPRLQDAVKSLEAAYGSRLAGMSPADFYADPRRGDCEELYEEMKRQRISKKCWSPRVYCVQLAYEFMQHVELASAMIRLTETYRQRGLGSAGKSWGDRTLVELRLLVAALRRGHAESTLPSLIPMPGAGVPDALAEAVKPVFARLLELNEQIIVLERPARAPSVWQSESGSVGWEEVRDGLHMQRLDAVPQTRTSGDFARRFEGLGTAFLRVIQPNIDEDSANIQLAALADHGGRLFCAAGREMLPGFSDLTPQPMHVKSAIEPQATKDHVMMSGAFQDVWLNLLTTSAKEHPLEVPGGYGVGGAVYQCGLTDEQGPPAGVYHFPPERWRQYAEASAALAIHLSKLAAVDVPPARAPKPTVSMTSELVDLLQRTAAAVDNEAIDRAAERAMEKMARVFYGNDVKSGSNGTPRKSVKEDDCAYRPATWFPKGMAARLRMAAQKKRKTKRVATRMIDGVVCYLVTDARRWWPKDVPDESKLA